MPLRPSQCYYHHVEHGQRDQPARRLNEVAVHLIDAERGENADRPREGPELVFEQRVYEHRFDDTMRQQVDCGELLAADGEMFGRRAQVCGDEIVGVSAELVVRQADDEALNGAGRKHEQQDTADELEEAVQPLEDDANFECDVDLGTCHGLETISRSRLPARCRTTPQLVLIETPWCPPGRWVNSRNSLGYHALGDLAFKLPYTYDISASDYDRLAGLLDVPNRGSGHGGSSPRGPGQRAREWRRRRRLLGERRGRPRADPEARPAAAAATRRAAQRRGDRVRRPLAAGRYHSSHCPSRHLATRDRGAFRATRCCARSSADSDGAPDAVRSHRRAPARPRHHRRTRRKA